MALVRRSGDSISPMRATPAEATSGLTHLSAQSFPATRDGTNEAASLKRGNRPPAHSSYWEDYKPILRRLYIEEERPLREVMEILENEFDFKATPKMYKSKFRMWGWRKNVRFDPDKDTSRVQDVINRRRSDDIGDLWAQEVRLANGQVVDIGRLHQYLRRKRRGKETPLTIRLNQPDIFHHSEAVFYSVRSHTLGEFQGRIQSITDSFDFFSREEQTSGRWLRFTDGIQHLMLQQDLDGAVAQMRRAPEEVADMVQTEPTVLTVNFFMYILKLCNCPALTYAQSRQVRVVVKSLLHYAASLLRSGSPGLPTSHHLQMIIHGLATASDSDLTEVASRAWQITAQAWAEIVLLDTSPDVSQESVVEGLLNGNQGEKFPDGMWFSRVIEGMIDRTTAKFAAANDIRCVHALHRKAELITYANKVKGHDCHLDRRLEALYMQMYTRGAQGAQRAEALEFLAECHRKRGKWDMATEYARLVGLTSTDSDGGKPGSLVLDKEIPSTLPYRAGDSRDTP